MLSLATGPLAGQPAERAAPRPLSVDRDLRRVEQGEADVNPLYATTTRDMGIDLRRPDDFSTLYQIDPNSSSRLAGRFARVAGGGGMVAVFSRGRYLETRRGLFAEIPPDTVYLLGGFRDEPLAAPAQPSELQLFTQVSTAVATRPESPVPVSSEPPSQPDPGVRAQAERERIARAGDAMFQLFVSDARRAACVDRLVRGR